MGGGAGIAVFDRASCELCVGGAVVGTGDVSVLLHPAAKISTLAQVARMEI